MFYFFTTSFKYSFFTIFYFIFILSLLSLLSLPLSVSFQPNNPTSTASHHHQYNKKNKTIAITPKTLAITPNSHHAQNSNPTNNHHRPNHPPKTPHPYHNHHKPTTHKPTTHTITITNLYHPYHNHTTINKSPPIIPKPSSHKSQNPKPKPMNPKHQR